MATINATKIMIVRHAEKPEGDFLGITDVGKEDKESLIVKGWQRSGALVALFDPARGPLQSPDLATPATIIASWKDPNHQSQRPLETVTPLATMLKITPQTFVNDSPTADDGTDTGDDDASTGDSSTNTGVTDAVAAALAATGVVLISWQHEDIPLIANTIVSASNLPVNGESPSEWKAPAKWPGKRFDLVWVFDIVGSNPPTGWTFTQVPQLLLAGDLNTAITDGG